MTHTRFSYLSDRELVDRARKNPNPLVIELAERLESALDEAERIARERFEETFEEEG